MPNKKIFVKNGKKTTIEKAQSRVVFLNSFFFILLTLIGARMIDLSLIQGAQSSERYDRGASIPMPLEAEDVRRGDIVDRNGVLLARSLTVPSLYADPKMVMEPKKVAREIVAVFPELSYGSVFKKLQNKSRFVWLKRNITPNEKEALIALGRPGLGFKKDDMRFYPQGELLAHAVGATGVDGQGLIGVERSFDPFLKTENKEIAISIDVRLQHILKKEIEKTMTLHKAKGASGLVMNVNTGEVLAAVSLPDFDPLNYKNAKDKERFNRFSLGVYELGSSFKIFSTAAYLEKNNNYMAAKFDAREPLKVGRFKIRDYHPEKRVLSVPEVFVHSSNIGTALMAEDIGRQKMKDFYTQLGLLTKSKIELDEIGKPLSAKRWGDVQAMTASYGHGIAVSPLQLVSAASAIVNGGYKVSPTLMKTTQKPKYKEQVISSETSHRMRQLLRLNVSNGTGGKADVEGFVVGGKTGTAEKPGKGGYDRSRLISSFLGFFPMNAPEYAIFVMVDEPQGISETYGYATGGWVGAPTVKRVISSMTNVLMLEPDRENKNFESGLIKYVKSEEEIKKERRIAAN